MQRKPVAGLYMGMAFAVGFAVAAAVLGVRGTDAESTRMALRLTARWSFLPFWLAYAGRAMAKLFGPAFALLARRGRELGLAFASALLVHVGLLVWLYWVTQRLPLGGTLFVFFAIGLFWTYLLMALSFGRLSAALGPRLWRLLRIVGMNYILIAFARDFVLSVLHTNVAHHAAWYLLGYVPFAGLCVAAPCLSLAATLHRGWGMRRAAA
ncbi:hypothetical protein [Rhodopila sp.]|uniref:hypothetical protein n=1 Tax=Rhodopila sp. TaxID=2480087 RepID=UPI003D12C406